MGKLCPEKPKNAAKQQTRKRGRPRGKHADQYVFQHPNEWEGWNGVVVTEASATHAMFGLLRTNYDARLHGFRILKRNGIQLP